jgi:hypothetical protein
MPSEEGSMGRDPFLDERDSVEQRVETMANALDEMRARRTLRNRTTARRTLRGDCYPNRSS